MPDQTTLQAIGLVTSPNELATPAGALIRASNCVLLAPGLVGCRKGQPPLSYALADTAKEVFYFGDTPIWQVGTSTLQRDSGSAFVSFTGSYTPADATLLRMKFLEMIQNLYFNTTVGVYRLDQATGVPVLAGVRTAPDFVSAATTAPTGSFLGFLDGGASCAYRLVFGTKDSHNTLHLGAPSGRVVVTNESAADVAAFGTLTLASSSGVVGGTVNGTTVTVTWATSDSVTAAALAVAFNADATLGPDFIATALSTVVTITDRTAGTAGNATTLTASGTNVTASGGLFTGGTGGTAQNTALTFPVPASMTTGDFWQAYRTRETITATGADFLDPGDEEYLAQEAYFTSAQIAAGLVSITDVTPDDSLGVPLYTNQISGEGILQADATPPFCKDIASWNGAGWYANTRQRQSVTLQILGTGAGSNGYTGVRLGDVITFGTNLTFTARGAYDAANHEYKLFESDDAGVNIENTARSLVNCINQNTASTTLRATYISPIGGPPGRILVQAVALDTAAFDTNVRASAFVIAIGNLVRAGTTVTAQTSGSHGLAAGDTTYIRQQTIADANFPAGLKTVVTVADATHFTYTEAGAAAASSHTYFEVRASPAPQLAWTPPPPPKTMAFPAGNLVRTLGTTVTASPQGVLTGLDALLFPGGYVVVEPTATADANFAAGTKQIVSVTSNTFTYTEAGSSVASTTAYQSGARVTSDPYRGVAGPSYLSYSKDSEPEAVPESNWLQIGRTDTPILRIYPLGQNLFVFKQEGVYLITFVGGDIPYRVDLLDSTIHLYAPDSVVSVSGRVFALTNQGVVAGTNAGFQILSGPIEQELFQYFGPTLATTRVAGYGIAHETDRQYILQLPTLSGASTAPYNAPLAYVYSTLANGWTLWPVSRYCGRVRVSDDAFYSGLSTAAYLQSNTKTAADYADGTGSVTATGWDSTTRVLTVTSSSGLSVGDAVGTGIIAAIHGTALTMSGGTFVPGTYTTYAAIPIDIQWRAATGGHPANEKQWRELDAHFRERSFYSAAFDFTTDQNATGDSVIIYPAQSNDSPYTVPAYTVSTNLYPGMPVAPKLTIVRSIPQATARGSYLNVAFAISEAFAVWTLNGITLVFDDNGDRPGF